MSYCPLEALDEDQDAQDQTPNAQVLSPDFYQDPALAMASLLRMMTRFPARCSPALAQSIQGHLQLLVCDSRHHPEVRVCAAELIQEWGHMAALANMPESPQGEPSFH